MKDNFTFWMPVVMTHARAAQERLHGIVWRVGMAQGLDCAGRKEQTRDEQVEKLGADLISLEKLVADMRLGVDRMLGKPDPFEEATDD